MGHTTDMPELREDRAAFLVNGLGYKPPPFDLLGRPDAGDVDVALTFWRYRSSLRDDEPGGRLLTVVGRCLGISHIVGTTGTGHRRHGDPVAETMSGECVGLEKVGHLLSRCSRSR